MHVAAGKEIVQSCLSLQHLMASPEQQDMSSQALSRRAVCLPPIPSQVDGPPQEADTNAFLTATDLSDHQPPSPLGTCHSLHQVLIMHCLLSAALLDCRRLSALQPPLALIS